MIFLNEVVFQNQIKHCALGVKVVLFLGKARRNDAVLSLFNKSLFNPLSPNNYIYTYNTNKTKIEKATTTTKSLKKEGRDWNHNLIGWQKGKL